MCVADDIIVYGTGDDIQHATEDHDKKLRELLLRCRKKGIRLNSKCQFRTNDITFLGHRIIIIIIIFILYSAKSIQFKALHN